MKNFPGAIRRAAVFAMLGLSSLTTAHAADDWTIVGTVLAPGGLIPDGAISVSKEMITAVGSSATIPSSSSAIKVPGVILPGFIDLHNHLTWNVLPRWVPARKFNNRYEWQDTAEYDRALVAPHNIVLAEAACETEIYAEVKAIVGGATSVLGGLLKDPKHPDNAKCLAGLARNLDTASGLPFNMPLYGHATILTSVTGTPSLVVLGGNAGQGNYFNNVQFAPLAPGGETGRFLFDTHQFPVPRWGHATIQYNNFVYVLGGAQRGNGGYLNDVQFTAVSRQ